MAISVHFYDRRNNLRKVVDMPELSWDGPFMWAEHSYSDDCRRSKMMYGAEQLAYSSQINLIVVEKIVSVGQVVYEELATPLPPLLVALLVAKSAFASVEDCALTMRKPQDLPEAVAKLKLAREALAACEDTTEALGYLDDAVERANKVIAYESDATVVLDVKAEWDELQEDFADFADLTEEASTAFLGQTRGQ